MVLRTRKSLSRISAFFSNSKLLNGSTNKHAKLHPSHLIWVLLASQGPQHTDLYTLSVDLLVKTLTAEEGIHSITFLRNTSPARTLSGSLAVSAKTSPASLLVYVDAEASFETTLQKLKTLLEHGESMKGSVKLHWSLSTYKCIQFHEPKRAKGEQGQCIVMVAIEPAAGQDEDIDAWYRREHLGLLSGSPLFLRCRRYLRIPNPSVVEEDGGTNSAKFLAVHSYTSVQDLFNHSMTKGQLIDETPWTRRVMDGAKSVDRSIWTILDPGDDGHR